MAKRQTHPAVDVVFIYQALKELSSHGILDETDVDFFLSRVEERYGRRIMEWALVQFIDGFSAASRFDNPVHFEEKLEEQAVADGFGWEG